MYRDNRPPFTLGKWHVIGTFEIIAKTPLSLDEMAEKIKQLDRKYQLSVREDFVVDERGTQFHGDIGMIAMGKFLEEAKEIVHKRLAEIIAALNN